MAQRKSKPTNARLNALNDYLADYGYQLDGEEGIGGAGHTAVWAVGGAEPVLMPHTVDWVEEYRRDKTMTKEQFLNRIQPLDLTRLTEIEREVTEAAADLARNSWRVGDAVNEYAVILDRGAKLEAQTGGKKTFDNASLSARLKLGVSPQRVGQLRNTAAFFKPALRLDGIAFEVYAEARKLNESPSNKNKLDAAKLAEAVKANPSVAEVRKALTPPPKDESKLSRHKLLLAAVAVEKDGKWETRVKLTIDGKDESANPKNADLINLATKSLIPTADADSDNGGTLREDKPAAVTIQ